MDYDHEEGRGENIYHRELSFIGIGKKVLEKENRFYVYQRLEDEESRGFRRSFCGDNLV